MNTYSEFRQDAIVAEILKASGLWPDGRCGFYVDVGAHDGLTNSNTLAFAELGWKGVCYEPSPQRFEKLVELRGDENCECVLAAISNRESDTALYREIISDNRLLTGCSGLVDRYSEDQSRSLVPLMEQNNASDRVLSVRCVTLASELRARSVKIVDYLSIDTEGSDYDVIASLNFKEVSVSVITIENTRRDDRIKNLLESSGFYLDRFVEKYDDVWVRKCPVESPADV